VPAITRQVNVEASELVLGVEDSEVCMAATHSAEGGLPCSRWKETARDRIVVGSTSMRRSFRL